MDLCDRIADRLSRSCDLRSVDNYAGYSASVSITLQLRDVDTVTVSSKIAVGALDHQLPTQHVALGESVDGGDENEGNLERAIDPSGAQEAPAKRQYVSSIRRPR